MKKILVVLFALVLCLSGCAEKKLASLINDDVAVYNVQNGFDADSILKDVQEGTVIETELDRENSELIITLTNGDKVETLTKKVEIQEPLSTVNDIGDEVINGYTFDVNEVVTDVKEGTEVNWEIVGNEITITLVNGDQTDIIKKEVNVEYPLGWFNEDKPRVDTYKGYDINTLVTLADGAEIISDELNDNVLSVKLSDGEKEETISTEVELYSSVIIYDEYETNYCGLSPQNDLISRYYFYDDGNVYSKSYKNGWEGYGTWDEEGIHIENGTLGDQTVFTYIADDWSYMEGHNLSYCLSGMPISFKYVRVN